MEKLTDELNEMEKQEEMETDGGRASTLLEKDSGGKGLPVGIGAGFDGSCISIGTGQIS